MLRPPSGPTRGDAVLRRNGAIVVGVVALAKADAAAIGVIAPALRAALRVSDTQLGLLGSVASGAGALCALPAGGLVDRRHRPAVVAIALVLWSGFLAVAGAAPTFAVLALARLASGGVATVARPVAVSLVGDLYRPSVRGRALAGLDAGQAFGVGVCYLLGALAVRTLGWRWLFWWLAAIGIAAALVAWRLEEPAADRPPGPSLPAVLRALVAIRTNRVVLLADSVGNFFYAGAASFSVLFVTQRFGLSTATVDALAPALAVGVIAGILAGGRLGDRLARSADGSQRLTVASISQLAATLVFAGALLATHVVEAAGLLFVGATVLGAAGPCLDAVRVDIVAPSIRGRAEATRGLLTLASSALGPVTFGLVATAFGGRGDALALRDAFLVMLIPLAAGGGILLVARRPFRADAAAAGSGFQVVGAACEDAGRGKRPDHRPPAGDLPRVP